MPISIQELRKLKPFTKEDDDKIRKEVKKVYNMEYRETHKEELKKYRDEHKEEMSTRDRKYNAEHKKEIDEYNKEFRKTHKKEVLNSIMRWKKNNPDKVAEIDRKMHAKRRSLGYEEILPAQWGCDMHHVDDTHVIPIPSVVHEKLSGRSTEEHIRLVDEWMREVRPDLWLIVHTREAFEGVFREMIERNKRKE